MSSSFYNHYNSNGEYIGSSVRCPGWMSPNFIAAVTHPLAIIFTFPLTPILTAWVAIAILAYNRRMKKLQVKLKPQKTNWNQIAWVIFMNILWIVWLFLYFIL